MSGRTVNIAIDEIEASVPKAVDVFGQAVVLVRDGDTVRAFEGKCPHAGAPFEDGAVTDGALVCPWHKAAFALSDGALLCPSALSGLARYEVTVADGVVQVHERRLDPVRPAPSSQPAPRIAIIGTGAAASAAIAELDARGATGRLTLIGPEDCPPYDRTILSKMVVSGDAEAAPKPVLPPETLAAPVTRLVGRVTRLDTEAGELRLEDGRSVGFDQALLATGSSARRPDLPGAELPGVHVVRSVADAAALVEAIEGGVGRAAVLGSGFVGLEVASGLRKRKIDVTVVTEQAVPFADRFGERIGARFRALHEAAGIAFVTGSAAALVAGPDGGVAQLRLEDGTAIEADLVVLGVGATPLGGLADGDGASDGTVDVDARMRVRDRLYAAGDIARFDYAGETVRIEHWQVAQAQGRLAARNMLGDDASFDVVPFFWTAQHGLRFDYLGHAEAWDEIVYDGEVEQDDFVALFVSGGRVAAAMACARDAAMARLSRAMLSPLSVERARALL